MGGSSSAKADTIGQDVEEETVRPSFHYVCVVRRMKSPTARAVGLSMGHEQFARTSCHFFEYAGDDF
jgi:hypothetical protein